MPTITPKEGQSTVAITGAAAKRPGNDPSELSAEIIRLRQDAALARALMGGTRAMRLAGETWLPRTKHESDAIYQDRLKISVLRNFYRQSLTSLAGKLMRKGLQLDTAASGGKGPAEMQDWLRDLDHCGTPGDLMFKRSFIWGVRDAVSFLLADYPVTGGTQSLADERTRGIRPWLIPLSIWDVCGWREENVMGRRITSQLRYIMRTEEPVGMFGRQDVETVRVVEPDVIRDFRKGRRGNWELVNSAVNTLGRVAFHHVASDVDENSNPRGGMADLAWLNMEHWQIRSDQRLTMRVNSFPILFGAGMNEIPPIGPNGGITSEEPNAKLEFVESGGAHLAAARTELTDLEDTMRGQFAMYQARPAGGGGETATGRSIDASEAMAPAQGWALNAKRAFEAAMADMAELAGKGTGPGAGGTLRVDTDALVSNLDAGKLSELRAARAAREISRETYLAQLKRYDVLPDDFDAAADQELIDNEPVPELEGMNKPPPTGKGGGTPPKGSK